MRSIENLGVNEKIMNKSNFEVLAFTPPHTCNALVDWVSATFCCWGNFKGINLHPSFCRGNFYHVTINDHAMVNHTHVIPHVILNLFQDLSIIKSLNRKETKPKSMSTTMVNNKSLPALEQIQDVSGLCTNTE